MSNYLVYAVLAGSFAINFYQVYKIDNMKNIQFLLREKDSLNQGGYNEILYSYISNMRDESRDESIKIAQSNGKIEGIISVVNNAKPEVNEISSIWHSGYYRGMEQVEYVRTISYEDGYHKACDDLGCPAGFIPSNKNKKDSIIPIKEPITPSKEPITPSKGIISPSK